jgi:putative transposase
MERQLLRKTYKYKLKPTAEQERLLERTLTLCRDSYDAAPCERREAWRRRGASITYYQQKVELPGIKAAMPEHADVNAQVSQDVAQRVDRAFQAFFRRIKAGQKPGYPRYKGSGRYNSVTFPLVGDHGSARRDNGFRVLAKLDRIAVRWSQPIAGTPKIVTVSREADGWYVCVSCAEAPTLQVEPTGQETGMNLG